MADKTPESRSAFFCLFKDAGMLQYPGKNMSDFFF